MPKVLCLNLIYIYIKAYENKWHQQCGGKTEQVMGFEVWSTTKLTKTSKSISWFFACGKRIEGLMFVHPTLIYIVHMWNSILFYRVLGYIYEIL